MTRRSALAPAMLAALHGAPSPLLAASPAQGARDVDDLLLVLGIVVGVAALALLMIGWLLAARTRDEERGPAPAEVAPARRARQRARAAGHDPVLAALGLDDDEASPPDTDG